jgi:hypothetical protein
MIPDVEIRRLEWLGLMTYENQVDIFNEKTVL